MDQVRRGRLRNAGAAPIRGESVEVVAEVSGVVVEQILSGEIDGPVEYLQAYDEWVVVLAGSATLTVDGTTVGLSPGEWLLLPRETPHRLESTAPDTSWLVVRGAGRDAG
jgi:cupin 2 domain-containing protein